jgi:hypothetical protein
MRATTIAVRFTSTSPLSSLWGHHMRVSTCQHDVQAPQDRVPLLLCENLTLETWRDGIRELLHNILKEDGLEGNVAAFCDPLQLLHVSLQTRTANIKTLKLTRVCLKTEVLKKNSMTYRERGSVHCQISSQQAAPHCSARKRQQQRLPWIASRNRWPICLPNSKWDAPSNANVSCPSTPSRALTAASTSSSSRIDTLNIPIPNCRF